MNISIIIPNYNGEKLLRKNLPKILESVKEYGDGNVEIIIPDDPSTDNSKDVIEKFISNIKEKNIVGKTIENKNMLQSGFSKNVNRGVSISKGDIIILLNSDTYPNKDFLKPLLRHFENEQVFAVGCMDESHENGKIILRGRGLGKFEKGFLVHRAGNVDKNNTLWVSGGSSAFRRSIWDKLGGLDPLYDPFYWEDIDLSYRAIKSGYLTVFEPKSVVTHEHEEGIVKETFSDKYVKKISYKNQFVFMWKNITDVRLIISHFLWLPYNFLKALLAGDWQFFNGFILAIMIFSKINRSRQFVSRLFVKTDYQVLKDYKE